ncbi:MAG: hydrogenase [Rhodocyclaceae bacterium]
MPMLLFGYGNPARGDDALGPLFVERLGELLPEHPEWGELRLLTDFQLQPEHALDLDGCRRVIFVDASLSCPAPFAFSVIEPAPGFGCTTHGMSPEALLAVFRKVCGREPPPAWMLGVRAESFGLGEPPGEAARSHLEAALAFACRLLAAGRPRVG